MSVLLAAALLFAQPDASGDALGDGHYTLPSAFGVSPESYDLRALEASDVGNHLQLTVTLGALANPFHAPQGFSGPIIDLFIKTQIGGRQVLDSTGLSTPVGDGWQYHIRLDGLKTLWWSVPGGSTAANARHDPLGLKLEGTSLVLSTPLMPGHYSYWVTSSVFSTLTPNGVQQATAQGGSAALVSDYPQAPPVVDFIGATSQAQAYATRVLAPVGEVRDRRSLALLLAAGAGLLIALVASLFAWRRR